MTRNTMRLEFPHSTLALMRRSAALALSLGLAAILAWFSLPASAYAAPERAPEMCRDSEAVDGAHFEFRTYCESNDRPDYYRLLISLPRQPLKWFVYRQIGTSAQQPYAWAEATSDERKERWTLLDGGTRCWEFYGQQFRMEASAALCND
jgi:hypothetical protein